jgi:hypothetical protein
VVVLGDGKDEDKIEPGVEFVDWEAHKSVIVPLEPSVTLHSRYRPYLQYRTDFATVTMKVV